MKLLFKQFVGEIPQADPTLLPEMNAVRAWNVRFHRGTRKPYKSPLFYREASKPRDQLSLYRFAPLPGDPESGWMFSWDTHVDCVPGPVAGNSQHLTYWTGEEFPKYTDNSIATGTGALPNAWYKLGVPAPEFAPHAERVYEKPPEPVVPLPPEEGEPPPEEADTLDEEDPPEEPPEEEPDEPETDPSTETDRDYVITFIHQLGSLEMESAPSEPSQIITVPAEPGFGVKLSNIAAMPSGPYPSGGQKRIYRRVYASGLTRFAFVAEVGPDDEEYIDTVPDAEIPGDLLISENFFEPKEDMHSLGVLTNGLLFGASANDVCISEPYLPHAWSPFARYPLPHDIVGLGQADSNIVAVTQKNPYIITGQNPSNMSVVELNMNQGCLSKRSIYSGQFGCVYASPDGLVVITQGQSRVLSEGLMTRAQWQALNPPSMLTSMNEEKLIISFTRENGTRGSLIFDPALPQAGFRFTDQVFVAQCHDGLLDSLLVYDPDMEAIALWNEGDEQAYTWRSRLSRLPVPVCFRCARVEADSYHQLTFTLYDDTRLIHTQPVLNNLPFRMPSGYRSRHVQVEISGLDEVRQICIAESVHELE